jgi:hypothetical protein
MRERFPSVIDVFAAPGGLSDGFRQAGYSIAAQIDIDHWGCETLRRNFCDEGTLVIEGDLRDISVSGRVEICCFSRGHGQGFEFPLDKLLEAAKSNIEFTKFNFR